MAPFIWPMSSAENTRCILDNYQLCHFHNPNFKIDNLTEDFFIDEFDKKENSLNDMNRMHRFINATLPEKYISCVRQLLNEGKARPLDIGNLQ